MNITKEEAISKLIDNEIDSIITGHQDGDNSYINDIFNDGFKGYQNFTNEELETELNEQFNYTMHPFKITDNGNT